MSMLSRIVLSVLVSTSVAPSAWATETLVPRKPPPMDAARAGALASEELARQRALDDRIQRRTDRALRSMCRGCEAGARVERPAESDLPPFDAAEAPAPE